MYWALAMDGIKLPEPLATGCTAIVGAAGEPIRGRRGAVFPERKRLSSSVMVVVETHCLRRSAPDASCAEPASMIRCKLLTPVPRATVLLYPVNASGAT